MKKKRGFLAKKLTHLDGTYPYQIYGSIPFRLLMSLNEVSTITVSGGIKHTFSRMIQFGICAQLYVRKLDQ